MSTQQQLTVQDRRLLKQVQERAFDNTTAPPARLNRLISMGLVEAVVAITLPIMPTRYNFRLTAMGDLALK